MTRKRGSIALARQLCYEIAGATSEDDDINGIDYGSVDVAEILSAEVERLRKALARDHAMHELSRLGQEIEQEPSQWRDMIVVTLVREGIDKHRARELADHFAAQPEPPPEWEAIDNIIAEYGLQAIAFVSEWKAAQRPWQGLTPEEILDLFDRNNVYGSKWIEFARAVEAALRSKNT
jgi:hypothetical protein